MTFKALTLATLTVLCAACGEHGHEHGENCDHGTAAPTTEKHEHGENCAHDHAEPAAKAHEHGEDCDHDHAEAPADHADHDDHSNCSHGAPQQELAEVVAHNVTFHVSMGSVGQFVIKADKADAHTEIRGTIVNSHGDESLKAKATTADGGKTYQLNITELPTPLTDATVILEIGHGDDIEEKTIKLK